MGVIRAEPVRVTDWAAKSVGAAWRAFDLQLAVYAVLLAATGLAMAYTNSVESGSTPLDAGTTFTRIGNGNSDVYQINDHGAIETVIIHGPGHVSATDVHFII